MAKASNGLKIVFLGGVGEIGKNMTVFEYDDECVIVDCGLTFPNFEESPGVEAVICDYSYLKNKTKKIKGVLITHGHEDHIGGLPYFLNDFKVPVYGSNIALALLQSKLDECNIKKVDLYEIGDASYLELGKFKVEFIRVTHSIPGSYAICLTTPVGRVLLTGDFKIDQTPIDNNLTDLNRFAEIGRNGLLLLMMDSTNVERNGFSMSEKNVFTSLNTQFELNSDKRIIVATFASNIHRVQQIINVAESHNRKVLFLGRSMIKIAEIAWSLGVLKYKESTIIKLSQMKDVPYDRICIICTGTQGEPNSALKRMSQDDFKNVVLSEKDAVLFSSSAIPGNESSIYKLINDLSRKGVNVIHSSLSEIHVSGHACKEELKLMFNLLKPKFFIPMHGEYRHLMLHKKLATEMGIKESHIFMPEIGNSVEVDKKGIKQRGDVISGEIYLDGKNLINADDTIMNERKILATNGVVVCNAFLYFDSNDKLRAPEIKTLGIIIDEDTLDALTLDIQSYIASRIGDDAESILDGIKRLIIKKFKKNFDKQPLVVVMQADKI